MGKVIDFETRIKKRNTHKPRERAWAQDLHKALRLPREHPLHRAAVALLSGRLEDAWLILQEPRVNPAVTGDQHQQHQDPSLLAWDTDKMIESWFVRQ